MIKQQYIKWKEVLPIYKGYQDNKIVIELQEHTFVDEDRMEVDYGKE